MDKKLLAALRVRLCFSCKRLPVASPVTRACLVPPLTRERRQHKLVGKTEAKTTWLLSDGELKPLPFITKSSSTYRKDGVVHLYFSSSVRALALQKYGSEEQLEQEKANRRDVRLARKAQKKRKSALEDGEAAAGDEDSPDAGIGAPRGAAPSSKAEKASRAKLEAASHQCSFGAATFDATQGRNRRVCAVCGAETLVDEEM